LGIGDLIKELGIAREGVITSYDTEENPDDLGPETYIEMQGNDGEVQAIVRLLSLPVKATPFHIVPAENDHGERDFINNVFIGTGLLDINHLIMCLISLMKIIYLIILNLKIVLVIQITQKIVLIV